jgi:outer membrane protein assembly factor BamB/actin-like ATPase involved in cell morphogenesis
VEYGLGVDLGTTYTAAAVRVQDRLEVVQLGSGRAEIPSVVFVKTDGEMLIGDAADRRGDAEPDRLVREFKRRMGDPVSIMVAGSPYSAHMLTARLLRQVVDTVTRLQQAPPRAITVAHPANWTRFKLDFLSQAVHLAELDGVAFRTEPEAAALQYAATERIRPGETLAVYDLGGGTFDAAVLRKTATGFELLGAPEGIEHLGGGDFDEAVLDHVTTTLGSAVADLDLDDEEVVAGLARLRRDCVRAKENLSADTETTIQVALPGLHTRVRLNRSEFEARIGPPLDQTVAAMRRALRSGGVAAPDLKCILLAGGAARTPLVGQLLAAAFDRPLVLDAHPEHSVALGAALTTGPAPIAEPVPSPAPGRTAVGPMPALPTTVKGVAKVGAAPAPAGPRPAPGPAGGSARTAAERIKAALASRRGRVTTAAASVLIAAVVAAMLWWPSAGASLTPPAAPSPSASAGPVQIFAAAVEGPIGTAVGVDADRVYFASGKTIQAVGRTDGKPAWEKPFTVAASIVAAPLLSGDTLYVSGRDKHLHAVDAATGAERWQISTGQRDPGPATVAGDAVYLGTSGGLVAKFGLSDQRRQWGFQTGNAVTQPPAVAGELVIAGSGDGMLYAFDAADGGEARWSIDLKASSAPVIAGDRVFVGSDDKRLHAIGTRTHTTDWTFMTGAAIVSTPVVDGALVYVGGQDGIVYAIEAGTGVERWRFTGTAGEKFGSPVVAAGVVYVAAQTGRIYALDAATARTLWKHDVQGAPGPPRIAGGVLYVGTTAKILYALRVAPAGAPEPTAASAEPSLPAPTSSISTPPPERTRRPVQNEQGGHPTRRPTSKPSPTPKQTSRPPTQQPTPPTTVDPTGGAGG